MKYLHLLALVVLLVTATGCASTRTVDVTRSDGAAYDEVNRAVRGKVARLQLHDGSQMDVTSLRVEAQQVTWVDHKTNRVESLPTAAVREVSIVKTGRGALAGLVTGVLLGGAVGAVRAVLQGDDPEVEGSVSLTRSEKLRILPAAHAVYASLGTTPIGAIMGQRVHYRLNGGGVAER